LPPVSTTRVANNVRNYQTTDNLKWTWRKFFFIYVHSRTQRCPNKIIKIFLMKNFFHLPPLSMAPVVHLELRISPRIFEKDRNGPDGKLRGILMKKTRSRKSRYTVGCTPSYCCVLCWARQSSEPEFVNLIGSPRIDFQPGGIDSS
jgi:hypothetical protein